MKRREDPRALLPGSSAGQAFEVIALLCVDRYRRQEKLFGATGGAEPLHQARVALRQLRSALAVFAPLVADPRFDRARRELRWLGATMNEVRDLDVLIAQIDDPPASLVEARERACAHAIKSLASARARTVPGQLVEMLEQGIRFDPQGMAHLTAAEFAAAALDRLRGKVKKKGRHLRSLDDAELHKLRIAAKKLRYAAEFFGALFPSARDRKHLERFMQALRALQDRLGALQDIVIAPVLLERLEIPRGAWPELPDRSKLLKRADAQFAEVLEARPFWR